MATRIFRYLAFAATLSIGGCRSRGAETTLSDRDEPSTYAGTGTRLTIVATNDAHGTVEARDVELGNPPTSKAKVGGLDALGTYLNIAQGNNPDGFLWLDAGDIYQGSLVSNFAWGMPMLEAFNALGLTASTLGNHEFDYGPGSDESSGPQGALHRLLKAAKFQYLSANLVPKSPQAALPNTKSSHIFERAGIKIGVIGATTATTPKQTMSRNIEGLTFKSLQESIPAEANDLRQKGAQVVILLTHAGGFCDMKQPATAGDKACVSPVVDEITEFLTAVPEHTVDIVLAGHMHLPQAHFVRGVPVVQTSGFASSLSMLDVWVNGNAPATAAADERIAKIEIHQPTYLCYTHYANYPSCNPDAKAQGLEYPVDLGAPAAPTFLGQTVVVTTERLAPVLQPYRAQVDALGQREVVTLPKALANDRTRESPVANCVVDALKEGVERRLATKIDLAMLGSGGIRTSLPAGLVRYASVYAVLPFDNSIAVVTLKGGELEVFGKTLSTTTKNVAILSDGWTKRLAKEAVFPRHRGFLAPTGAPPKADQTYTVLTADFNTDPLGESAEAFATANAEGRVRVYALNLRDVVADRLADKSLPLPASCQGAGSVRTSIVDSL